MTTDRRKIAEGREAEIFDWEGGSVLKLYRTSGLGDTAEEAALTAIASAGGPAPVVRGRVELDSRPGLLIERLGGTDMLALLGRRPWRLVSYARMLADTQAAIHRVRAPQVLPETRAVLAARIAQTELPPALKAYALEQTETLPGGDRLLHGDLHPGNVIVSDGRPSAIDWSNASRGHHVVDLARTMLLLRIGEPLAASAWMRSLIGAGRRWYAKVFSARYARGSAVDPAILRRAYVVNAAARLWEGIAEETGTLTGIVAEARG